MAKLTEENIIASIDVDQFHHVGVLRKTIVKRDGEVLATTNSRVRYAPGDDDGIKGEDDRVRKIAALAWTKEVRAEYAERIAADATVRAVGEIAAEESASHEAGASA